MPYFESGWTKDTRGAYGSWSHGTTGPEGQKINVGGKVGTGDWTKAYGIPWGQNWYVYAWDDCQGRWGTCDEWRTWCQKHWMKSLNSIQSAVSELEKLIDDPGANWADWEEIQNALTDDMARFIGGGPDNLLPSDSSLFGIGTTDAQRNAAFCRIRLPNTYESIKCAGVGATKSNEQKCKVNDMWVYPVEYYAWQVRKIEIKLPALQAAFVDTHPTAREDYEQWLADYQAGTMTDITEATASIAESPDQWVYDRNSGKVFQLPPEVPTSDTAGDDVKMGTIAGIPIALWLAGGAAVAAYFYLR